MAHFSGATQPLPKPAMKDQLRTYLSNTIPMNLPISPLTHFDLVNQMANVIDQAYNDFERDRLPKNTFDAILNPNSIKFSSGHVFQLSKEAQSIHEILNTLPSKRPDDPVNPPRLSCTKDVELQESVTALQHKYMELESQFKTLERRVIQFTGHDVYGINESDVFGSGRSISADTGRDLRESIRRGQNVCIPNRSGQDVCGTGRNAAKPQSKCPNPFSLNKSNCIRRFF